MFITDGNIELFKGIGRDGMMGEGEPLYEMVVCDWGMQLKTSTEPIPAFSIYCDQCMCKVLIHLM